MNILIDRLPESIEIEGTVYPINFGFRALILCELCVYDKRLTEKQQTMNALGIFYKGHIPENVDKAVEMFLWFFRCGKKADEKPVVGTGKTKRYYDFEQDADYIYSAYLSQYRIDLHNVPGEELHWWKFRAMFDGLDENHRISKIMVYRLIETTGMSKEQKKFYQKMKNLYAIKEDTNIDEKMKLSKRNQQMLDYVQNRSKSI